MESLPPPKFVPLQGRGTITLPADLRRRHHLDEPGAQLEVTERSDGVIELRPHLSVPADQAWFWSERWQRMERDADADVVDGRVVVTDSVDDFFDELDSSD